MTSSRRFVIESPNQTDLLKQLDSLFSGGKGMSVCRRVKIDPPDRGEWRDVVEKEG